MKNIYTIGHSIHKIDDFLSLIKNHSINTIVDVRSMPYSKFASQYNKENLSSYLKKNKLCYIFMGNILGARYDNEDLLFENGKVNFKKVQTTKSFQDGITRLEKGIKKGYNISLMCSEKEAFDCHRFGLISEFLSRNSIEVNHIYPNKIIPQKLLEKKLLKKYKNDIPKPDLFNPDITEDTQIQSAYELRNKDIAYNAISKEGDD